jgi:hypothetical protein
MMDPGKLEINVKSIKLIKIWFPDDDPLRIETCMSVQSDI